MSIFDVNCWLVGFALSFHASTILCNINIQESKSVVATEAFFLPIKNEWFSKFNRGDPLEYAASLMDMPDLPHWMFSHPINSSNAYLYGSAEEAGNVLIEIIAMNKNTYDTAVAVVELNVERREKLFQYEVEMKFLNLNVDEMFRSDRLNRLLDVFKSSLWKGSEEVYITKVVSPLDVGGRLPLNPKMKEGVVVRIGGTSRYSRDLEDLEREVQPLRNRSPCPRDYKRTSVEHLFRSKNFVSDWCSFRLITEKNDRHVASSDGWSDRPYSSVSLTSDNYDPHVNDMPRRDFTFDFIISIIIPTAVVGVLSTALICVIICNKEGIVQLNQFNPAANQNDGVSGKQDGLQRSGSVPDSSLPTSQNASPMSTLPKGSSLRASSRSGTLRSLAQPPPPPYATSSYPPSYGGSARNVDPCT